jgi:phosphoribosylformimino-5-aminoimidazole carboxamide ribotide isomerase
MAARFADQGATYLHVVDLDGAFAGESANEPHIQAIIRRVGIPVEVGGGVRSLEKARRLLDMGASRVIVGTRALEDREFLNTLTASLPGQVNVGVDARDGWVAVRGWTEVSQVSAEDFLAGLVGTGVAGVIYTDISRDGALTGVNVEAMRQAVLASPVPVIASGGVASLQDIQDLSHLPLFGIIVGKAFYEGRLELAAAMAALP